MIRWAGAGLVLVFAVLTSAAQPPRPPRGDGPGDGPPRPLRPVFAEPGPPKLDAHGDPLPAGAVARFGSVRLRHGSSGVRYLEFTPDGKRLLTAANGSDSIRLWDVTTGKEVARHESAAPLLAPANSGAVVLAEQGRLRVWLPDAGAVRDLPPKTLPDDHEPTALAVHPDCKSCAVAVAGKVRLIDLQTGKAAGELKLPPARDGENDGRGRRGGRRPRPNDAPDGAAPTSTPDKLLYSPDGKWLAGSGQDSGVWLWNLATGKRVRTYRTEIDAPEYAFSPDVTKLVVTDQRLRLFALDSEEEVEGFRTGEGPHFAVQFSADGKVIYSTGQAGTVTPHDADTGAEKDPLPAPDVTPNARPVLAPGGTLVAIDDNGRIQLWDPKTGKGPDLPNLPPLFDPGFGPDGKTVTVLGRDNALHTFDPATGTAGKPVQLPGEPNLPAAWHARTGRGAVLSANGDDFEAQFVDAGGKVLARYAGTTGDGLPQIAFAAAARDRAALFYETVVVVVNPATGKVIRTLTVPNRGSLRGDISPDGRLLAVIANGLTVWEVATGKKRLAFARPGDPDRVAFSPDGRFLAAADGSEIVVLDVRTGAVVRTVQDAGGDGGVGALAFDPAGARLAVGFQSGGVTVWDVGTGEVLAPFAGHDGEVNGLAFSADGRRLVSCADDGTALVWAVPEKAVRAGPAEAAVSGFEEALKLLGAADPAQAQRGLDYLYRNPAEAVKQIAARVVPPVPTSAAKLAGWVADLGSDDFPTREAATDELSKVGGEAAALLREAAAKSASAEVRKRANDLLAKIDAPSTRPDDLRAVRAAEVLEGLRSPEAWALLEKWAQGPPGHRLTVEAAAVLARLRSGGR